MRGDGSPSSPALLPDAETQAYHELQACTLPHPDPEFLHQHVVDTWTAQHANAQTKPIAITLALVSFDLRLECGLTGRVVQQLHGRLARRKRRWPTFQLPAQRGSLTARAAMAAPPGPAARSP